MAVLRLSGPDALALAQRLCPGGPPWRPRRAALRRAFREDAEIDQVLAVWMPGPRSYTGEDVVELSGHGNPVVVEMLLDALVALGARPARPGEFTRRAVENGRMSLLSAEALAGLIAAGSPAGARLAQAGLAGAVEGVVARWRETLLDLAAEVEARLDYPGEDLGFEEDAAVVAALAALAGEASAAAESWRAGRRRLQGASVALIGPVNAGKSSLFNRLVGQQRALVSPAPGTTRDVIERAVLLAGMEVTFLDTAGEREAPEALEAAGIALGQALTAEADLLLVVLPLHQPLSPAARDLLARTADRPRLVVGTHLDLASPLPFPVDIAVSNATGAGLDDLQAAIQRQLAAGPVSGELVTLLSQRQHDLCRAVADHASAAADALLGALGPVVAAEEITAALERLAELTGEDAREAVLDRLFSRFCIGK